MSDRHNRNSLNEDLRRLQQQYPELVSKAKQINWDGKETNPIAADGHWKKAGNWLKELLAVDSAKLHGKAYVTEELESHSRAVAGMVTIANLINAGTAFPLLLLTMADMGMFGLLLAAGTNLGLINFGNQAGEVAAANKPGNQFWSETGLIGLICLNLLQSVVSGVGTQLLLDRANISNRFADNLIYVQTIEPLEAKVKIAQFDSDEIESKKKCQELEAELAKIQPNTPKSGRLFNQAYGSYEEYQLPLEQRSYYNSPPSQWAYCPRAKYEEAQLTSDLAAAQQKLQEFNAKIADRGSLAYLRSQKPDIYNQHFDEVGELKSGMEATTVAVEMFWDKLIHGQWASLGLSMYIFGLSVITSAIAVILVATHSKREDVQMSWSPAVARERERFLQEQRDRLLGDEDRN